MIPLGKKIIRKSKLLLEYPVIRGFGWVDRKTIRQYLFRNDIRKLHIGCGDHILDGWLNSDYYPPSKTIIHLDATKPYPIAANSFDYIFSEHMIEHVSYSKGLAMLAESFRILKENGKIRISTPDLAFLINLYKTPKSDLQQDYIKWAMAVNSIKELPSFGDTFVINNFVRAWGHLFIYDEKTLRLSMEKVGFTSITRCDLGHSEDETLRNLENEKRMPNEFLRLETFTLEGTKSGRSSP